MKLSLVFFIIFLLTLLSHADQTDNEVEFDSNSCLTSRRLLFFGGLTNPFGEKKPEHVSSSSKSSSSTSSPPKYARADVSHGLTVYIRPQTSSELGHKVRSYSHLLKSKLFTKEEQAKLKKHKKNKSTNKKKNSTQSSSAPKTQDLVAINDQERDRCRALLQIDHQNGLVPTTPKKQIKKVKNSIPAKVKNATAKAKKQVAKVAKTLPIKEKKQPKIDKKEKIKQIKNKSKPERKDKPTQSSETTALTPPTPIAKEVPTKKPTTTTAAPPPPPPPTPSASSKPKREKQPPPPPVQQPVDSLDANEEDEIDNEEQNHSVVNRAYSFVKNMFQLSDDILDNNHTNTEVEEETDTILSSPTEQSKRQSRKLLSFIDERNLYDSNDFPFSFERIFKRQLLSVKTSKQPVSSKTSTKKVKTTNYPDGKKPKVGWAYRYRISRYLADQKLRRTGGGKIKQQLLNKKPLITSTNTKVSKRKLLEFNSNIDLNIQENEKSNQDIVDTVLITQDFVPKRQLLASKKVDKVKVESDNDGESSSDAEKASERRRLKSYHELTDPVEIVRSYDRGLFKPRVGWQFRYRVSRYIDSLRENIREDQERLKLGLQAIKRKTPQELSGRRKRVLDKPFTPEPEETPDVVQDNKPNVGWRYRYRISKMLDAKQRGEYIDDEELKRQARLGQKPKGQDKSSTGDDDECLEWEFDLDPELRKINDEGRRVGWAYRYRIRRKLDELKLRQAEKGIPFDLETLGGGGKREKKATQTETTSSKDSSEEKPAETNKKAVGWQYRYRVSKMLEAQKNEAADRLSKSRTKKQDDIPASERLDPVLAQLKPEDRAVGWAYRYRIRRKLDALNHVNQENTAGRRSKKSKQSTETRQSSKDKKKEEISKKIEESIEKILNIDDLDETPFMEYFRRTSSYILFGLVPTAKKSICLLASSDVFTFCNPDEDVEQTVPTTTPVPKVMTKKKLKTKKEKQAKQFIQTPPTKFETAKEIIDDPVKPLSKVPKTTTEKPKRRSNNRRQTNEQVKHYDEEEHPIKKLIGVETKKKSKKRFQIIGQEVKFKPKQTTTTTTTAPVVQTTTSTPPVLSTTTAPPPPPEPEVVLTTTSQPPSPEPEIVPTTTSAPLRTISEIIQEEAATLLTTPSSFVEETKEEINEANEIAQSTTTATTTVAPSDNPAADNDSDDEDTEEDSDSESSDSESSTDDDDDDDDNTSNEETNDKNTADENFDPLAVKKMKKFYESAKESVHGVFDIKDEQNNSP